MSSTSRKYNRDNVKVGFRFKWKNHEFAIREIKLTSTTLERYSKYGDLTVIDHAVSIEDIIVSLNREVYKEVKPFEPKSKSKFSLII